VWNGVTTPPDGRRKPPLLPLVLAAVTAALLCACASQARRGQAALGQLGHALPGTYDSSAQSAGAASGVLPVTLSIVPATAQLIGKTVFFVREAAAANSQLVLWQGVWTLTLEPKSAGVVQHIYLLKDPRRWIGAAAHPDRLLSMLPQDLQPLPGCDVTWSQGAAGGFVGAATAPRTCRPGSQAAGLWMQRGARLSGAQLTLTERRVGSDGALVSAGAPLSLLLERTASAPADSPAR